MLASSGTVNSVIGTLMIISVRHACAERRLTMIGRGPTCSLPCLSSRSQQQCKSLWTLIWHCDHHETKQQSCSLIPAVIINVTADRGAQPTFGLHIDLLGIQLFLIKTIIYAQYTTGLTSVSTYVMLYWMENQLRNMMSDTRVINH